MALAKLSAFKSALGGGLRANKYKVILTLPTGVDGDTNVFSMMVSAANIPAMETGIVEINKNGRVTKVSGDERPAGEWAVTARLENGTKAATAKKIADKWQKLSVSSKNPADYQTDAIIEVVTPDKSEKTVLKYRIESIWINNSGELSLSDDTVDEVMLLDMVFQYEDVIPLH